MMHDHGQKMIVLTDLDETGVEQRPACQIEGPPRCRHGVPQRCCQAGFVVGIRLA